MPLSLSSMANIVDKTAIYSSQVKNNQTLTVKNASLS
jgi:hypothetical protein